jgi:glutathione S-transferase
MFATLEAALSQNDFLVDDYISAADILVISPFTWMPDMIPDSAPIRNWIARCEAAQDMDFILELENAELKALGLPSLEERHTS